MSKVAGLDWATQGKDRVLVVIECGAGGGGGGGRIELVERAPDLRTLFGRDDLDVIGVDIPFAWPREFCSFVSSWSIESGARPPASHAFRYRLTDRIVKTETGQTPMAVTADRFAMGARAWAEIVFEQRLFERIDVVGSLAARTPAIIEVYPSATARALFGAELGKFKAMPDARAALVGRLLDHFSISATSEDVKRLAGTGKCSDEVDALLAAVTAVAFREGAVRRPATEEERAAAKVEGWIFFPTLASRGMTG